MGSYRSGAAVETGQRTSTCSGQGDVDGRMRHFVPGHFEDHGHHDVRVGGLRQEPVRVGQPGRRMLR